MSPAKKTENNAHPDADEELLPETEDASADTADPEAPLEPVQDPAQPLPLPADIAELSYEAARDQLVDVVRQLETGSSGLEESIALWERGEMLARRCQQWLDGARERLSHAIAEQTPATQDRSGSI